MATAPVPIQRVPPPVEYIGQVAEPGKKPLMVRITAEFNRWLLTLTAFVNQAGFINGNIVDLTSNSDFEDVVTDVNNLNSEVGTINGEITTINGEITTINGEIGTIDSEITTINNAIAALPTLIQGGGAPAAGLGKIGDWYADTSGKHIWVKTSSGSWLEIV